MALGKKLLALHKDLDKQPGKKDEILKLLKSSTNEQVLVKEDFLKICMVEIR